MWTSLCLGAPLPQCMKTFSRMQHACNCTSSMWLPSSTESTPSTGEGKTIWFDWRCSQADEHRVAQQSTALSVCCFLMPVACCLLPTAYCLPTALCPQPSALSPQPSALSPQPSALSPVLPAPTPQPDTLSPQASLPTGPCLLPFALCLLPFAGCHLLPSAYCPLCTS